MHYIMHSPDCSCTGKRSVAGVGKGSRLFDMLLALRAQASLQPSFQESRVISLTGSYSYRVLGKHWSQLRC